MYEFEPLDLLCQQIRLVHVIQSTIATNTTTISCKLVPCEILQLKNRYSALSYTWGPPEPTVEILVDGKPFMIRENLYHFLWTTQRGGSRGIWIDQICIDQSNDMEKNHQVKLMGQIYSNAAQVIIWLGPAADESERAIRRIGAAPTKGDLEGYALKQWRWEHLLENEEERAPLRALFARPYWTRIWILQEILLAQHLVIFCGNEQTTWDRFKDLLSAIHPEHWLESAVSAQIISGYCPTATSPPGTLWSTFEKFCDWDCVDLRDKIFGLLSLVPAAPISPRYDLSCEQLCIEMIRAINAEGFSRRPDFVYAALKVKSVLDVPNLDVWDVIDEEWNKRKGSRLPGSIDGL